MAKQTPKLDKEKDLSFEEQLKLLSKSIGITDFGGNSDQICREVRGKE
ncbi:hypothetical protein [Rossellomorea aquimaris]|uniref:Uncharacterized protein n=1 Tax=Rossellomorea aquimaris TaxID=189382 RepID=A0A366EC82_9BACI|nr:hypothetical protein [Rossellomorea aquimaris]RBO99993.1 hypothetical protein DET59_12916 [Rossellomorea aquimaris]